MRTQWKALRLASFVLCPLYSTAAAAQETQRAPPAATDPSAGEEVVGAPRATGKKSAEEEIVVTGTRIRRKDLTTPAPVTVISREQVEASGKVSIGDFLQSLPEQGNAINTQVNYGGNGATRVSLRGLGVARTLVLLNGRRFVPGGNGANDSVDLNSIPTAAIDHIEVLKDGGSALYGSDAIGGVVNIITKKRGGTEVSAFNGISPHGDGTIYDFNGTTGASSDLGSFTFSGGFYKQQPVWAFARGFSRIPLAYDATGRNNLTGKAGPYSQGSGTTPAGTIVLSSCTSKTPASSPCIGRQMANPTNDPRIAFYNQLISTYPTAGTFIRDPNSSLGWRPFTTTALSDAGGDGWNFQPDNYLVTPAQRISLFSSGETRLGSVARGYFEASYVNRQSEQKLAAEPLNTGLESVTVSKDNFYNPFGVDLTSVNRRLLEFSNRITAQDINTFRVVTGVDGTLPQSAGALSGWYWDVSLNYGRTEGTQLKQGNLKLTSLEAALGASFRDPATGALRCGTPSAPIANCVPLNLFGGGDPSTISADQIAGLTYTGTLRGVNQMTSLLVNTSGELFRLYSDRPAGLAVGYEYRFLSGENIPDPITVAGETTGNKGDITRGHYYVNEGYAELSVPILSHVPFAEDIEAIAAFRVSDYSTFGTHATYKFGGRYRPIRDVTLRGTYSTAFRAPSVSDLFLGQADSFPNVSDPCAKNADPNGPCRDAANNGDTNTQLRTRIGGNPDLKPETAHMVTAGVVLEPRMVRNFSVTVDYYNVTVENTITTIGASTILTGCYGGSGLYCDLIQRDPLSHRIVNIGNLNTNVGTDRTDGIDVGVKYGVPTQVGRFGFDFIGTWLHKYNRTLADGKVIKGKGNYDLNNQGTGGVYPAVKFLTGVNWALAGLVAGVNTRFVSSFTECGTPTGNFNGTGLCYRNSDFSRRVASYNQWDLFAAYTIKSPAGRTTLGAGINNVFDRAPSAIYNGFTAASDPEAYDFIGRFVYARLGHNF